MYIAPGAKIFGNIRIPDNTAIGANAVVNKSFEEENTIIAGIPAKVINKIDITKLINMPGQTKITIRGRISNLYRNSEIGYIMLKPFYKVYEFAIKLIPDKAFIKWYFKRYMGYSIDIDNPQTLNEKITWLKLYDRSDLHTRVADKYTVRDYIAEKIGEEY